MTTTTPTEPDVKIGDLPLETILDELSSTSRAELWIKRYRVLYPMRALPTAEQVAAGSGVSERTAYRALAMRDK